MYHLADYNFVYDLALFRGGARGWSSWAWLWSGRPGHGHAQELQPLGSSRRKARVLSFAGSVKLMKPYSMPPPMPCVFCASSQDTRTLSATSLSVVKLMKPYSMPQFHTHPPPVFVFCALSRHTRTPERQNSTLVATSLSVVELMKPYSMPPATPSPRGSSRLDLLKSTELQDCGIQDVVGDSPNAINQTEVTREEPIWLTVLLH